MPYCAKCGASVAPDVKFCQSCGSPMGMSSGSQPPMPPSPVGYGSAEPQTMRRPTGVTILAILDILSGIGLLGFGALFAVMGGIMTNFGAFAGAFGGLFIVFALISFAAAYAFWTGQTWGWWLGVIVAILDIISIVSLDVISFIIGIIILYYLTRPHVKAWFHKT